MCNTFKDTQREKKGNFNELGNERGR